ncbi:hypothetical protein [Methylobacterium sp. Leaf89]|uniref:hypothetical protein n=1 Tax=Methylobacterium sp. Leaf89 TaxID=1736245 RepID=UPI000A975C6A|nr:hypothetical protein [Methylobacterium sp. Leaf89]
MILVRLPNQEESVFYDAGGFILRPVTKVQAERYVAVAEWRPDAQVAILTGSGAPTQVPGSGHDEINTLVHAGEIRPAS